MSGDRFTWKEGDVTWGHGPLNDPPPEKLAPHALELLHALDLVAAPESLVGPTNRDGMDGVLLFLTDAEIAAVNEALAKARGSA